MAGDTGEKTATRQRFGKLLFILMAVGSLALAGYLSLFPGSFGLDQTNAGFFALALIASGMVDAIIAFSWDRIIAH